MNEDINIGAIILCGGESQRMGLDKWRLPVGEKTLLEHVAHSIQPFVHSTVLAAGMRSIDMQIDSVKIILDRNPASGPMEGIRAGLEYLEPICEFAYVTACDIPMFNPDVLALLMRKIGDSDAAIPITTSPTRRVFGMTAVYRTRIHARLDEFVRARQLRVSYLADALHACLVPIDEIREVDNQLGCLANINCPADYLALLDEMGLECPPDVRRQFSNSNKAK